MDKDMSKNQLPLVSVVMPVYNGGRFLKESIESVLAQTYSNFELIIINDGSSDESESLILSFTDNRIKYLKNETNKGLVFTLNRGLQEAKGEYIARMDGDDICLPQRFEKQVTFLNENLDVAILATLVKTIDEQNSDLGFWNDDFNNTSPEQIANFMSRLNCIAHPSVMVRASVVKQFGYTYFKNSEDWGLWLKLLSKGYKIAKLNSPLLLYRIHTQSMSNAKTNNAINRIIAFKWNYFWKCFISLQIGKLQLRLLSGLFKDFFKYKTPLIFALFVKYKETRLLDFFKQYRAFKKTFSSNNNFENKLFFFFPFYHIGGAEIVHLEIVKAASHKKPLVFFTSNSLHSYIFDEMCKPANVLRIDQLLVWPFLKRWAVKKIINKLSDDSSIKLFSANSKFFYSLLKSVPSHIVAIDLIHAFMHKHEVESSENWSLPVVDKLNYRIIINNKTRNDFRDLYASHNIDLRYLERIKYIANFVEHSSQRGNKFVDSLNVLYVGRNTPEKRVELIARVAREIAEKTDKVKFHFAGDVGASIPETHKGFCKQYGEVSDRAELNRIYDECHVLILASEREGFPLVIMEAMMHGLVTVSTAVGGIPEHVNDDNGILIDEASENELIVQFTKHIMELANDNERLKKMGENAYHYAKKNFSKEAFYNSYKELFN
jgi:glycosyltransferase involved in cell wall biosynthesis